MTGKGMMNKKLIDYSLKDALKAHYVLKTTRVLANVIEKVAEPYMKDLNKKLKDNNAQLRKQIKQIKQMKK